MTTHRVYWSESNSPKFEDFGEISLALAHSTKLRQRKQEGEAINFVIISSEIDECTSLDGVASPSPDYNWKKRRT